MKLETLIEIILSYILLISSIIVFHILNLDVNFIISFIFAIITLSISILFFTESSKVLNTINERVLQVKEKVDIMKTSIWFDEKKVKDLNISTPLNKHHRGIKNGTN